MSQDKITVDDSAGGERGTDGEDKSGDSYMILENIAIAVKNAKTDALTSFKKLGGMDDRLKQREVSLGTVKEAMANTSARANRMTEKLAEVAKSANDVIDKAEKISEARKQVALFVDASKAEWNDMQKVLEAVRNDSEKASEAVADTRKDIKELQAGISTNYNELSNIAFRVDELQQQVKNVHEVLKNNADRNAKINDGKKRKSDVISDNNKRNIIRKARRITHEKPKDNSENNITYDDDGETKKETNNEGNYHLENVKERINYRGFSPARMSDVEEGESDNDEKKGGLHPRNIAVTKGGRNIRTARFSRPE